MDGLPNQLSLPSTPTVVDQLRGRTDDWLVQNYIKLRDRLDEQKKAQREANTPLSGMMLTIENIMLERLQSRGALNTKTAFGTAYVSEDVSVTVRSWTETLPHIQENALWDLLEARVNKTAALTYMEESSTDIPGVVVRRENVVHIRRTS